MTDSNDYNIDRYDKGKQTITLLMNLFVLSGFVFEIINFNRIYLPLQSYLQLLSAFIFLCTLVLLLINRKRFYVLCYLICTYFLIANIVIYDIIFPEFVEKLQISRSEFFSRDLYFILPFIAIVGFISSKKHIIIQGIIILFYIIYQYFTNNDVFIKSSILNYVLTTIGFCWVAYFLVGANQRFIKNLHETNSKLRNAQQKLIQSEKMASLGTLTAGVAHEINNPLNFIQGGVYGLESYLAETNQDNNKNVNLFINGIKTGIERVSGIVNGLNQFSRDTKYNMEVCDIHSIIENCLIILHNSMKDRISVLKEYTSLPYVLNGNTGKLHQVFLNILTNASQAINEHGKITVSTKIESANLNIKISDSGIGISPENIPKVIEPFFTTKEPGKGTGLGLSISYSIIKEHNGEMSFESEPGKGTTVNIKFPITIS
jgi:signal transduction histidine kinase